MGAISAFGFYVLSLLWFLLVDLVPYDGILFFVAGATLVMLYVVILFGPALYSAVKRRWAGLLSVLITQFLWAVIVLAIVTILEISGVGLGDMLYEWQCGIGGSEYCGY